MQQETNNTASNLLKTNNRSGSNQAQTKFVTTEPNANENSRGPIRILAPLSPKGNQESYESFKSWKNAREHLNTSGSPVPQNREMTIIQDKFRQTLGNGNGFHKKAGYFTNFVSRNKIVLDQYNTDQKPGSSHTRYSFKPVFFTALETKNKLYETSEADHSTLIGETQKGWTKAGMDKDFKKLGTSIFKKDPNEIREQNITLQLASFDNGKAPMESYKLPNLESYQGTPSQTPRKKPLLSSTKGFDSPKSGGSNLIKIIETLESPKHQNKSMMRTSYSYDKFFINNSPAGKSKLVPLEKSSPNTSKLQEITKYQTKTMTSKLIARVSKAPKIDVDQYMEHNGDLEYKRDNSITIPIMQRDRMHRKNGHETTAISYMKGRTYKGYQESDSTEDIKKFEESLTGWAKSIPNFGKQRSTYTMPK